MKSPSPTPTWAPLSCGDGGDGSHDAGGRNDGAHKLPPRPRIPPGHGSPVVGAPHPHDVLSGRGGRINSHPGNVRFRALVDARRGRYLDPRTRKAEKSHIAARIVADVRALDPPGRFLRQDQEAGGTWTEIGDERAFRKAGQALRESAPEIRAERQARLHALAGVPRHDDGADAAPETAEHVGRSRRADPPGPRHRPNPPAWEGLGAPRGGSGDEGDGRDRRSHGRPPSLPPSPRDLALAQMRREYLQLQRLQKEQELRMLQYQRQLAAQRQQRQRHADRDREEAVYDEYLQMVRAQLASVVGVGGRGGEAPPHRQEPAHADNVDQRSRQVVQETVHGQHFHSRDDDETVHTLSSFDAQSMGMSLSSLGNFDWNQSQTSMLTSSHYDMSGLTAASGPRTSGSRRGGGDGNGNDDGDEAPAPTPARETEQATAAHRPRRSSGASHGRHLMSSLGSFGFDTIEEDELSKSSDFQLSRTGLDHLSAMDATFGESATSVRGADAEVPLAEVGAARGGAGTRRGKDIGRSRAVAEKRSAARRLAGAAEEPRDAPAGRDESAAAHDLSMEDFGESFMSMVMEERGAGRPASRRRGTAAESAGTSHPHLLAENMGSLRTLDDLGASLGGSSWLNQLHSVETFGMGGDESGDISAPRMVMATGGDV